MKNPRTSQLPLQCRALCCLGIALFILLLSDQPSSAESDEYIRGYAEAVLEKQLQLTPDSLTVENGVITVVLKEMREPVKQRVQSELSQIRGVRQVEIVESASVGSDTVSYSETGPPGILQGQEISHTGISFFGKKRLFEPLIADPRWPHFSISYQFYIDDDELKNVGATSFGETLPFYADIAPFGGEWQVGLQAAVFALFDLDAASHDLINADYWVGIPLSYRGNAFSAIFRLFHQSSHLGDEFLLRSRVDRVNLSYEALDFKASYDLTEPFRVYAGSGYIMRREPDDLKRWSLQYGVEFRSPRAYVNDTMKPVAGADFKNRQESDWNMDISLRTGIEIESEKMFWNRLYFLIEYFYGFSPHGQFYDRRIEYLSLGTHFYF